MFLQLTCVRNVLAAGESLPDHIPDPLLKVQRIENISVALQYLQHRAGVHLPVHAEGVFV